MASAALRRAGVVLLLATGLLLWLGAMFLLAMATEDADRFGRLYGWLFLLNALGVLTLLVLIVGNLIKLVQEYRSHVPGSRLKSRMVATFVVLALVPLLIVYYFSIQFLNRGIESWFSVDVEKGLSNALNLSRATLETQMRDYAQTTEMMAKRLRGLPNMGLASELSRLQRDTGAGEITVVGRNNRIVASISEREDLEVRATPNDEILLHIRTNDSYVALDPIGDQGYQIRTAINIPTPDPFAEQRILLAIFPVSERISSLADAVQTSYAEYGELSYMRRLLKYSLSLTLTMVLLLSLLAAVWGAFFFSRRLVAPIQDLIAGTRAVAHGDLDTQLPLAGSDDMGFLVRSFNDMTRRLSEAREVASSSQLAVENERAYLAVILGRLSTGVVSLETDWRIRTANEAAGAILGVDLAASIGSPLLEVARGRPLLEQFVEVGRAHIERGEAEWREQIVLRGEVGRRVLMCACSALPSEDGQPAGYVVVFDDITALIQAQRDSAWGEVARRLAHEIKNPLTPIQLSAERMRRRFLEQMQDQDAEILERATRTIIQQVEGMKQMVNAFSEYARAPDMNLARTDLNRLVREVAELYRVREIESDISLELDPALPEIEVDGVRIRQILHNLIRNGIEALEHQPEACLTIATGVIEVDDRPAVSITVRDNGPGFPGDALEHVFDPYVTTKPKGTGLGLAIVKKLVEEHGGKVEASNVSGGGAMLSIVLPADETARAALLRSDAGKVDYRRERA
ncbi:MAG: ATP-binding protein [Gammaproteobacteria bacterium]